MISIIHTLILTFIFRIRFPSHSAISSVFLDRYGRHVLSNFRKLEKTSLKLSKAQEDLRFLNICRSQSIFPKFLRFKLYKESLTHTGLYRSWQLTLLEREISTKLRLSSSLDTLKKKLTLSLRQQVSFVDFHSCLFFLSKRVTNFRKNVQITHNKKLNNLGVTPCINECDPSKVIFNLSHRTLSERQKFLLSFGLEFGIPSPLRFVKHYTPFEFFASRLKSESIAPGHSFSEVCDSLKHTAKTLFLKAKRFSRSFLFRKHDYILLKELKSDSTIIITRPDKGRGVVLLDKSTYISKMNTILSDTSKFTTLPHHTDKYKLVLQQEDSINRFLRKLLDNKIISPDQYTSMRNVGASLGVIYGLPKVHKNNTPLRPILAAYNTPSFNLAQFLVPLLEPFTKNEYTVPNSYSFCNFLKSFTPSTDLYMASFDITSLFTNIPLAETIDIICEKIFSTQDSFLNFDRPTFKKLLSLACHNTYFLFNDTVYHQFDGVAMGSPLGPTLANIFLCHYESQWLASCPSAFKPLLYKRYVDDTFTCFRSPDHISSFLTYLNSQHPNIKFTVELPTNNTLPFLDVNATFENNSFITSVYRKPTFTGLGTNFHSFLYSKFKVNSIKTLIYRAYHISSSYLNFHNEITFLKKFFYNNGYPTHLFDNLLNAFLNKVYTAKSKVHTVPKKLMYISLPFYGKDSERYYVSLFRTLSTFYPHIKFVPILKTNFTLASFFPFKDRIPSELRACVIYKYNCSGCNATYIGSTLRRSLERFHEHLGKSVRTGRLLANPSLSHIRNHCYDNDHPISLKQFSLIDSAHRHVLSISESLHIYQIKPCLNIQQSAVQLLITP